MSGPRPGLGSKLRHLERRLALVGRLAETWVRRPPSPTRLVLDLTRRCNLRCRMCRTWAVQPREELDASEIALLLRAMPRLAWLDLTGGEPFVRADIEDVFAAVVDATPALKVLHFQTNGWATRRIVESTAALRARRPDVDLIVTVSIDGPPALHHAIRGRDGAYPRAIATADALAELGGVQVHVGTTLMADNAQHIGALESALRRDLRSFEPRRWHLNRLQVSEHFFANGDLEDTTAKTSPEVIGQLRRRGLPRSMVELMELVYLVNLEFVRRGEPSGIPCQALRSAAFISPEGDLYPCHIYDRPLGNVRTTAFERLWASQEVARARKDIEALACGGCFSACEAYPALAGAPLATLSRTSWRLWRLWRQ